MSSSVSEQALRTEAQRKWRTASGKVGATIYLNRHEIDILDWVAFRLMADDKRPEAVGRPAALRSLLADVEKEHGDEIGAWAMAAPDPAERASLFHTELGVRRRGPNHANFAHLPREQQQRLARKAMAKQRNIERRQDEAEFMHDLAEGDHLNNGEGE